MGFYTITMLDGLNKERNIISRWCMDLPRASLGPQGFETFYSVEQETLGFGLSKVCVLKRRHGKDHQRD